MNQEDCNEITCGDPAATRFLLSYFSLVHMFDDVYDKDKEVSDERLVKVVMWWTQDLMYNPWVREHGDVLWSQIITGWNAWLDANAWAKQPNPKLFDYQAAIAKIDTVSGSIYNLGGGAANTLSLREFLGRIETLGLTLNKSFGDVRPGDQPIFVSDNSKAKKELGWEPKVGVEAGIKKLYDWFAANKGKIEAFYR